MTEETRIRAEHIQEHITLLTKDGRKIGNAFVISLINDPEIEIPTWLVQTEFGAKARLTEKEIEEQFHLGYVDTPCRYFETQLHKLLKNAGLIHLSKSENRRLANEEFGKVAAEIADENNVRAKLNQARRNKAKVKPVGKKPGITTSPKVKAAVPKNTEAIFNKVFTESKRIAA